MFIEVAVPIPGLATLTYSAEPSTSLAIGMRVVVTVGRQAVTGMIVKLNATGPKKVKIKPIVKLIDEQAILPDELLSLGQWLAGYYRCSWGEALHAMLPGNVKPGIKETYRLNPDQPAGRVPSQAKVLLHRLGQKKSIEKKELLKGLTAQAGRQLRQLEESGVVIRKIELVKRRSAVKEITPALTRDNAKPPSRQQQRVLADIQAGIKKSKFLGYLLYGVTGSGKTEVYLQTIEIIVRQGQGAMLLVPEIALTTQMQQRITARFGDLVAVLHSQLTPKARLDAWTRLLTGEARVVLGARSAVFAPVRQLKVIIIDEEYEPSFKQEDVPRYHAREVAAMRAKYNQALIIYGAATPSLESYYRAQEHKLELLTLPERIDNKAMPKIELVDMSREIAQSQRFPIFSNRLLIELADRLEKKEQSILFLNRRGFAPLVMCPSCHTHVMCPDCSVALVYHLTNDQLHCHSCGRQFAARPACPKCGTACIKLVGSGTQRVEEELKRHFPSARVVRLDQDESRKKGLLETTIKQFEERSIDILVGTQMVAKGIDFREVTLVGIISADTALFLPDFRAEERTFQLMVQVAGRAGRGGQPGLVIAQTNQANHDVLLMAANHDYETFYQREIKNREQLGYPPFRRLVNIICRSTKAALAEQAAERIAALAANGAAATDRVLGPAPSPYQRVAKETRYQVLIKAVSHASRLRIIKQIEQYQPPRDVKINIDVDPISLL